MAILPTNNVEPPNDTPEMYYTNPLLGTVLGMAEVIAMWGKTRRTVEMAIWKGKLEARKMVTGGAYLITRESVVRLWGQPKEDYTDYFLSEGKFYPSKKDMR